VVGYYIHASNVFRGFTADLPEPATLTLFGLSALGVMSLRRRRAQGRLFRLDFCPDTRAGGWGNLHLRVDIRRLNRVVDGYVGIRFDHPTLGHRGNRTAPLGRRFAFRF